MTYKGGKIKKECVICKKTFNRDMPSKTITWGHNLKEVMTYS